MGLLRKLQSENGGEDSGNSGDDFSQPPEPDAPDATAKGSEEAASEAKSDTVPPSEGTPAEIVKLEMMMKGHDWWYSYSDDPTNRSAGSASEDRIYEQLKVCEAAGLLAEARELWVRYAPNEFRIPNIFNTDAKQAEATAEPALESGPGMLARRPGEPFSEPYRRNLFNKPLAVSAGAAKADAEPKTPEGAPVGASGAGGQTDLLSKALSVPFAVTAAAGSLIVNGLRAAGTKMRGFYAKGRESGHAVLGQQLDEAANNIVRMTDSLKQQGMGDFIADLKATGRPAREIFEGMKPGGAFQNFHDRFSALMRNDTFAQQYAHLEDALSDFGFKASHYAQSGVELNRDYSDAVERNLEKISAATEGFVFKKGEVIKHLQELARSISETVSTMINNLLGRHKPQ